MNDKINGRTPEEIKRGLECCMFDSEGLRNCDECPYVDDGCIYEVLNKDTLAYIRQLEAAQPKWISVEERLPEEGQKVLVCGVKKGMQVGAFRGIPAPSRSRLWWWKKNTLLEVTHWKPLPEPPKEEA